MAKKVAVNLTAMEILRQGAVKEFGETRVKTAAEFFDSIYGIPLDGLLPLQYILGMDVLPLNSAICLVGKPGSLKSLMAWEFINRILRSPTGGLGIYLDVEKKTDPVMIRGIVQNDVLFNKYVSQVGVRKMSEFTRALKTFADLYQTACPRRDIPLVFLLDSLNALASDTGVAAMKETGSAADASGFDDARKAAELTKQLRAWVPEYLHEYPFLLLYVNHLKERVHAEGGAAARANFTPEKVSPGAVHKDFMNSFTIEMTKENLPQLVAENTVKVWMTSRKAAFAHTSNRIVIIMHSHNRTDRYGNGDILSPAEASDEQLLRKQITAESADTIREHIREGAAPGITAAEIEAQVKIEIEAKVKAEFRAQRKYVYMDWNSSLIELLTREKKPYKAEVLKDIVDIENLGKGLWKSKRLGVDQVTSKELGAAIHAVPKIVEALQDVLGIYRKRRFSPG